MYEHISDTRRYERTVYELQAVIERPDGTVIRPCAFLGDRPLEFSLNEQDIKNLTLKGYGEIEKSKVLDAWVEIISIRPESTVIKIFPQTEPQ